MAIALNLGKFKEIQSVKDTTKAYTVLVVDDEPSNIRSLVMALKKSYHILTAQDGKEALEMVKNHPNPDSINLIISDQRMPNLTGVEFLKQTLPLIPKTMRIILTGYTDVQAIIDSINEGQIYKFLTKPIEINDLMLTVQRALEAYELSEQNESLLSELQALNASLEVKVQDRTTQLQDSNRLLEQQNETLNAANRKLSEMHQTKEHILKQLSVLYDHHLPNLEKHHLASLTSQAEELKTNLHQVTRDIDYLKETLRPIKTLHFAEQNINNKKVLLAEPNKKQQMLAKMALGGTGVQLDIVSNMAEGEARLNEKSYDMISASSEMIPLLENAHKRFPQIHFVFMTSEDTPEYLKTLQAHQYISNIISRQESDRAFTLKSIVTTVSKLLNQDLFGLEKYLNWGTEVHQYMIVSSSAREQLIGTMEYTFNQLGVRRNILQKCAMIAEEILMNAIYDAPVDANFKPLYNHLPRTTPIELKVEQQGVFRFACDGLTLAVSAEDPFGMLSRETIIQYLTRCYAGDTFTSNTEKGGAGRGLFQVIETADLVVINVKSKIKTEVIAIFNIEASNQDGVARTSFHYFNA